MAITHPDVSEYQTYLDNSFTGQFIVCRSVNENGGFDTKFARNMAQAKAMVGSGKIINAGTYIIPCIISNDLIMAKLDQLGVPNWWAIMIDMEGWGGRVVGDHSTQLNQLAERLRARQQGRADLAWGYGNRGDLAGIWPNRPAWMGFYVAGYGGSSMSAPGVNMIGWQYTNGVENGTSYPSGAAPFGNCDMNVRYTPVPTPTIEDDFMTDAQYNNIMAEFAMQRPLLVYQDTFPGSSGMVEVMGPGFRWHVSNIAYVDMLSYYRWCPPRGQIIPVVSDSLVPPNADGFSFGNVYNFLRDFAMVGAPPPGFDAAAVEAALDAAVASIDLSKIDVSALASALTPVVHDASMAGATQAQSNLTLVSKGN